MRGKRAKQLRKLANELWELQNEKSGLFGIRRKMNIFKAKAWGFISGSGQDRPTAVQIIHKGPREIYQRLKREWREGSIKNA